MLLVCGLVLTASAALAAMAAVAPTPQATTRLEGEAFGETVVIRAGTGAGAEAAARAALDRIHSVEEAVERTVATLNDEPEQERAVEPPADVLDLFARALTFCNWSDGAHGPLGGNLQAHWRAAAGNPEPPPPPTFAVESAACDRVSIDRERGSVRIAGGSRVDLSGFAAGFAVDRAVDTLRDRGVDDALVRVGRIHRGIGPGPEGDGWPVLLPVFEGYRRPLDEVRLRGRSLAVVWRSDWPSDRPLFVDQRSGRAPGAPWATAAVTELAVDAQALAVSAMVLGSREGRFRMAGLDPEPSVLWLLGSGEGRPLMMDLRWSALRKR
jgi:thiamine biosynthesis lipoprotein